MKKKLRIVLVVMLLIVLNMFTISLADNTNRVSITAPKSKVESGETFDILIAQESDGLTGFESILSYDTNVFTLTKKETLNGWIDIGNEKKLDAMANQSIGSGDVFKLTFSVKENVPATTSEIKLTDIKLYKNSSERTELGEIHVNIDVNKNDEPNEDDEKKVALSKLEITKAPNKINYKEGETFDPTGMEITATYQDNSYKNVTDYTYSPNTALKTENKLVTISYQENGVAKSVTQSINVTAVSKDEENDNNQNNGDTTELKGITFDKTNLTLVLGETTKMNLIVRTNPSNATLPEIVWTTSNEKVAKLEKTDTNGSISIVPVATGKATITAKTKDGKYSATTEVTVNGKGNASGNTSNTTNTTTISGKAANTIDNTTTSGILPKTGGKATYLLLLVAGLIGIGVVSYRGYKKYKGI